MPPGLLPRTGECFMGATLQSPVLRPAMHPHNPHPRFLPPFNPQPDPQLSILQPQHPRPPPPPPSSEPSVHDPDPRDTTTNYALLKGPKRKRLAKVRRSSPRSGRVRAHPPLRGLLTLPPLSYAAHRPAMPVIRASADATAQVRCFPLLPP